LTANQATFESLISALEHYARDSSDLANARLAFSVLTQLTAIWGGPNLDLSPLQTADTPTAAPSPSIQGFDTFVLNRFSPLAWAIPASPNFRPRDPQARAVVIEIAGLQLEILRKTGSTYIDTIRSQLSGMGLGEEGTAEYLSALIKGSASGETTQTVEQGKKGEAKEKGFRGFLVGFMGRGREG